MAPSNETLGDKQLPNARHYPLDIDLPFDHYEHRLVARDILVNRVMSKLLFPGSKGLAQAYDVHRSYENGLHNFAPIKRHDESLARDLELLRKMLTTCSSADDRFELFYPSAYAKVLTSTALLQAGAPRKTWHVPVEELGKVRVTVGEEIRDLVRRHYLETDDACLRLWLQTIQPPSLSSYNTLPSGSRAENTHAAMAQRRKRHDAEELAGDGKKWYKEDAQRLADIRKKMREARLTPLHDGGASLPQLRLRILSSKAGRVQFLASSSDLRKNDVLLHHESARDRMMDMAFPWPEGPAPRRVLHVPSCGSRSKRQWLQAMESSPPVDFSSGVTGRGLQRSGFWSTAACGDGVVERGRSARRTRRRATSEPPHGMFTSARLPRSVNLLRGTLIFPQMKLGTMYQRSRRRSLSRTRIAEMFDWKARSRQVYEQERRQQEAQYEAQLSSWQPPWTPEYATRLDALNRCGSHTLLLYDIEVEEVEGARLNRMLHRVLDEAAGYKSSEHPCPNCAARHLTCPEPCGFCGAPSSDSSCLANALSLSQLRLSTGFPGQECGNLHKATDCPVAKQNRCKCGPFPQYHVAAKCAVLCSRDCGNIHPAGHFKHKNAMTCKSRCCMCGIKGHSGSQCKSKRCRCGGAHLGQDCTWKVECRVEGCYRFLCGLHCSECGMSREQLEEGSRFEGRKCPVCLGTASRAHGVVVQSTGGGEREAEAMLIASAARDGTRRRKNPRKKRGTDPKHKEKEKDEADLPWYTPLQRRTRPIVVSKSGKRSTWRGLATK